MHKYKKIAILADGTYPRAQYPLEILAQADIVICCDASVEKLKGREPNFIVGDMDTLSPTLQEKYSDIIHKSSCQETNDLTKSFSFALGLISSAESGEINILGATGCREDHSLGNISLLAEYAKNSERIASNEAKLVDKQKYLHSLQNELATKEKSLNEKISSTSAELSNYKDQLEKAKEDARKAREAARKAEEEAKKKVKPVVPEKPKQQKPKPQTTVGSAVSYTDEDVELLAALIECEAGYKDYEALLAVGAVVANRMKHPNYPDSVYGVIYHPGQFPPATNGKMDVILERGVKELCVTAAKDALNGKTNVEDCISFRAASSGRPGTIIGTNVFFF